MGDGGWPISFAPILTRIALATQVRGSNTPGSFIPFQGREKRRIRIAALQSASHKICAPKGALECGASYAPLFIPLGRENGTQRNTKLGFKNGTKLISCLSITYYNFLIGNTFLFVFSFCSILLIYNMLMCSTFPISANSRFKYS